MKSIVQTGPESVTVQDRPKPTPDDDEVLVRVHAAGLCGSDAHAYKYSDGYEWVKLPRVMGHEYAGEVVEAGANVTRFEPGDPVVEEPVHSCGRCFQCENGQTNVCRNFSITGMHTDGAYAEYVTVRADHAHPLPESIPLEHASVTEPTSVAARAVLTRSSLTAGDVALVEGPGPIGVLVASVADAIGATVVVSGLEKDTGYRLPLVERLGIDAITVSDGRPKEFVDEYADGVGFDVVFDATGHESGVETATDFVRKGGEIVAVGLPDSSSDLYLTPLVRGEVDLVTSYGSTWRNFEQAIDLVDNERIDVEAIVDTSFSVDDPESAFKAFFRAETCKPVFSFV